MAVKIGRKLVPLALIVACSSDGSGPNDIDAGEFSYTVSGGLTESATGDAFYVVDQAEGLAITLSSNGRGVVIGRINPSLPAVGSHPFVTADDATDADFILTTVFGGSGSSISHFCQASGGTMEITASGSHLTGTFTAALDCFSYSNNAPVQGPITIEGSFDATQVEPGTQN